jgi:AraC-like DNA-binding protein
MASELNYSYPYLSHVFSEEIGLTIKDYYKHKRFEKAMEWLKDSSLSITEIADKLQYKSIHAFSKAFHKDFGIPPIVYRSMYNSCAEQ